MNPDNDNKSKFDEIYLWFNHQERSAASWSAKRIAVKLFNTSAPGIPLFLKVTNIASAATESDILTNHWEWRYQADS